MVFVLEKITVRLLADGQVAVKITATDNCDKLYGSTCWKAEDCLHITEDQ